MARREFVSGEAAERTRRRRLWAFYGTLFAIGLPIGFFAGRLEDGGDGGFLTGTLPPWFALLAAVVTTVVTIGGSVMAHRRIDELERRDNRIAAVMGSNAVLVVYPPWYFLWRGGLVGEPRHEALFLLVFGVVVLTYAFLKLRNRF